MNNKPAPYFLSLELGEGRLTHHRDDSTAQDGIQDFGWWAGSRYAPGDENIRINDDPHDSA